MPSFQEIAGNDKSASMSCSDTPGAARGSNTSKSAVRLINLGLYCLSLASKSGFLESMFYNLSSFSFSGSLAISIS